MLSRRGEHLTRLVDDVDCRTEKISSLAQHMEKSVMSVENLDIFDDFADHPEETRRLRGRQVVRTGVMGGRRMSTTWT